MLLCQSAMTITADSAQAASTCVIGVIVALATTALIESRRSDSLTLRKRRGLRSPRRRAGAPCARPARSPRPRRPARRSPSGSRPTGGAGACSARASRTRRAGNSTPTNERQLPVQVDQVDRAARPASSESCTSVSSELTSSVAPVWTSKVSVLVRLLAELRVKSAGCGVEQAREHRAAHRQHARGWPTRRGRTGRRSRRRRARRTGRSIATGTSHSGERAGL